MVFLYDNFDQSGTYLQFHHNVHAKQIKGVNVMNGFVLSNSGAKEIGVGKSFTLWWFTVSQQFNFLKNSLSPFSTFGVLQRNVAERIEERAQLPTL